MRKLDMDKSFSEESQGPPDARLPPDVAEKVVQQWWAGGCSSCCGPDLQISENDESHVKVCLAEGHVYWSGSYWFDYLFHVCQRHPLAGIVASHPLHPFSKCERVSLEFLRVVGTISYVVCTKHQLWIENLVDGSVSQNPLKQGITIYFRITLPITIVMAVLMWLAMQTGRPDACLERHLGHSCAKVLQWWVMCICCRIVNFFCVGTIMLYTLDKRNSGGCIGVAWRSIVQGYVLWFVKDNLLPSSPMNPCEFGFRQKWEREEREEQEASSAASSAESMAEGFFSRLGWR